MRWNSEISVIICRRRYVFIKNKIQFHVVVRSADDSGTSRCVFALTSIYIFSEDFPPRATHVSIPYELSYNENNLLTFYCLAKYFYYYKLWHADAIGCVTISLLSLACFSDKFPPTFDKIFSLFTRNAWKKFSKRWNESEQKLDIIQIPDIYLISSTAADDDDQRCDKWRTMSTN